MIRCEVELDVARPAHDVFEFLDDVGQAPKWLGRCVKLEQTDTSPRGVGTRLRYVYKDPGRTGEMDGLITAYEKDHLLEMKYSDRIMDVSVAFKLEAADGGTHIAHTVEITPKSFVAKLMQPILRGATKQQVKKDTAKLKEILQKGA